MKASTHQWAGAVALTPRWFLTIALIALLAFAAKTSLALFTYGTNDVTTFEQDLKKLDADGWQALYRDGAAAVSLSGKSYNGVQVFSHPPFMLHVLPLWRGLAQATGLPLQFWLRFACAFADLGSLWLLCLYRSHLPGLQLQPAALLLFAASPILLMISGFHGNTDPILMFLVLLSVYAVEVRKEPALGGAILALAMGIKVVAVIFALAVLLFNPTARARLRCFLAMLAVALASAFPYVFQNPFLIIRQLSRYSSTPRIWGWSIIAHSFDHSLRYHWVSDAFTHYEKAVLLLMLGVLSIAMNWQPRGGDRQTGRWPLFAQCGLLAFFFLFFAPGFSVQYLAWLAPWTVVMGTSAMAIYHASAGAFLFAVYHELGHGFPWYYANFFEPDGQLHTAFFIGLACWFLTGVILLLFVDAWINWRRQPSTSREMRSERPNLRTPLAATHPAVR